MVGPVDELFPHSQKTSSDGESQTSFGVFTTTEVQGTSRVLVKYIVYGTTTHVCVYHNVPIHTVGI